MTHEERVKRVVGFGFTHRQAAFLVEVMLHSGFFLGRQYCTFARIARGQKLVDFLEKLTTGSSRHRISVATTRLASTTCTTRRSTTPSNSETFGSASGWRLDGRSSA